CDTGDRSTRTPDRRRGDRNQHPRPGARLLAARVAVHPTVSLLSAFRIAIPGRRTTRHRAMVAAQRRALCSLLLLAQASALGSSGPAQAPTAGAPPGDNARVEQLLNQLTVDEQMRLIHDGPEDPHDYQGQAGYVGGVPRLGIPGLRLADGPPGV